MSSVKRHYRIKSRVRFTIFAIVMMLLLIAAVNLIFGFNQVTALESDTYQSVQVKEGDTLWSLASEYMPEDMDPRESVYLICAANQTSADSICPGQILKIPTNLQK